LTLNASQTVNKSRRATLKYRETTVDYIGTLTAYILQRSHTSSLLPRLPRLVQSTIMHNHASGSRLREILVELLAPEAPDTLLQRMIRASLFNHVLNLCLDTLK
jgi:hypothetical protein